MEGAASGWFFSSLVGFVLGVAATVVGMIARDVGERWKERRTNRRDNLKLAYGPACAALQEMEATFPDHAAAKDRLRKTFLDYSYLFEERHRAPLWAAVSEKSDWNDVIAAREAVCRVAETLRE
jgi:hypothetical protein